MDVREAIERVLQGESLAMLAAAYRTELLRSVGLEPKEAQRSTFQNETRRFINKLCRELGDRHAGDPRVLVALRDWVVRVNDYEAWDALLASFQFEGKETFVERGRTMFPGPLTAHWDR